MGVLEADDSSSILAPSEIQRAEFAGMRQVDEVEVEVRTLNDLVGPAIARPALLEIDVQGYELEALEGASSVLARIDDVLVECSFVHLYEGQPLAMDVAMHLDHAGFQLIGVHNVSYSAAGWCARSPPTRSS